MISPKALGGRIRWQLCGFAAAKLGKCRRVCHWRGSQNVWGKQPWNLDCIRFSFHLIECQTALTWITYVKCRAIHMVSGARYVFFQCKFMGICVVKIWKVTTAFVRKKITGKHSERETQGPCCPLCMQHFHFHTRQQEIQRSQLECECARACVSPLVGASITVQGTTDT